MKKSITILFVLLFSIVESNACLNDYYSVDSQGHLHSHDDFATAFNKNFNLKLIESKLIKLEKQLETEKDYKLLSNYAVLLLKAGKTSEALAILEQLSVHHPDEYQITANLGTAYELNGEVDKALEYIKKGIELNPDSHGGSEWVHVKVLEAKQQLEKGSLYLSRNSVLNLTEDQKNDTLVRNQILIQVRERFPFSPGPNQIMSSLCIDLGDCFANTESIEFAKVLYTIAKLYYGANDELVDEKISKMVELRSEHANVRPERRTDHVNNIKIGGITYGSMLDDNNRSNHKIVWEKILTNVDELLNLVNLERIDLSSKELSTQKTKAESELMDVNEQESNKSKDADYMIYFLFGGGLALLIIALLIFKKRAKK
ncbi:MAG: hypothetical protein COA32_03615 [Fluviicola sp.]|nr:MAG: hypothetical protein COA32_03615 [Fluviicola sp.]